MLIDIHMHAFKDELAPKAIKELKDTIDIEPACDGTIKGTLACMERDHVDFGVIQCIQIKPGGKKLNEWAIEINKMDRFYAFGGLHPMEGNLWDLIVHLRKSGIKGFKIHPTYQLFYMDDPVAFPMYEMVQDTGMPLMVHAGFDPYIPDAVYAAPDAILTVRKNFPKLNLILAHMGGMQVWDAVEDTLVGEDFLFDTSLTSPYMDFGQAVRFIKKHGAERILFGSDFPWSTSKREMEWVDRMPLTGREKDCIFYQNASALLKIGG